MVHMRTIWAKTLMPESATETTYYVASGSAMLG